MWTVDSPVDEGGVINVDSSYPQFSPTLQEVGHIGNPQVSFSVYSNLEDLLGFPRSYYYY